MLKLKFTPAKGTVTVKMTCRPLNTSGAAVAETDEVTIIRTTYDLALLVIKFCIDLIGLLRILYKYVYCIRSIC